MLEPCARYACARWRLVCGSLHCPVYTSVNLVRAEDSASRVVVPECLEETFSSNFDPVRHLHPSTPAHSLYSIFESRAKDYVMQRVLGVGIEHLRHPFVLQLTKDV